MVIAIFVAGYTYSMLSWFRDYYEFYLTRGADKFFGSPFAHAGITTMFHKCYPIGLPLCLAVVAYGIRLVWRSEVCAAHLAWYASLSIILAAVWLIWTLAVERSFYILLFWS